MKKKNIIIIAGVVLVAIIGICLFLVFNNKKTVEEKYYNITFNTDGGSVLESIKVKENGVIKLPDNPTKEGYKFKEWTIADGEFKKDMKVTKDIILVAVWEEIVDEDDQSDVVEPKYVCISGYTLSGTKCIKTYDAAYSCSNGAIQINGKCVELVVSKKVAADKTCKTGTKTFIGYDVCKGERISVDSQSSCENAGGVWFGSEGACYEKGEMTYSCQNGYEYISNPNEYNSNIHGEVGCYPITQMSYTCNASDRLEGTKCVSTIEANVQ